MIYILFACFCVFFVASWIQIRRVKKHDGVLFPFCQLRRDITRFLYESVMANPCALSHEEYKSARRLSGLLDNAIRNYNRHKTVMFNLRKVTAYLRKHQAILKQMEPLELTENPDIQKFYARFAYCSARAFIVHTPLFRSEIILRAVIFVSRFVWREGNRRARYLIDGAAGVRKSVAGTGA